MMRIVLVFWEMPSGKLEFGETVGQGLRREVFEEIGIDIAPFEQKLLEYLNIHQKNQGELNIVFN